MGLYLNPNNLSFLQLVKTGRYVDKTMLIAETNRRLDDPLFDFVCISRPRRFGKSVAGDMLSAYYSKGADSRALFAPYKIAQEETFSAHLNAYNVVKIDLNALFGNWQITPEELKSYPFITHASKTICAEFAETFTDVDFSSCASLADCIQRVFARKGETFVIIIDEYDVLVREGIGGAEFTSYLAFLNSLFKNAELRPAISLAYLTGIIPIMRDRIQSKLNTFDELTMLRAGRFSEFTGFTTAEVRALCERYGCDFDECRSWYDGYKVGVYEIYNPQAVMKAVVSGEFASYWSGTSTYEVVAEKVRLNFAGTKEAVITMLGGGKVALDVESYENRMDTFRSKDDVFTFLIHLGYLAYDAEEKRCYIPNREIHSEWQRAIKHTPDYAATNKIIRDSERLLQETLAGNERAVAEALDESHIHVTSNRSYNNEDALQSAVYLAYIYALNEYMVVKEMTAGKGFADIVYIPFDKAKAALIVELKRNGSAEGALRQIRDKRYFDCLARWRGVVLFVGINYDADTKQHSCRIERFVK